MKKIGDSEDFSPVNKKSSMKKLGPLLGIGAIVLIGLWAMGQYNGFVSAEEPIAEQWSNVENAYQLRADKTKNLLAIVKGAADFEQETLTKVIEARSQATSIKLDASDLTPENMQKFEAAQQKFSGALSRLLVTVERYPDLKAVAAFRDFQTQYEGMENRIGVERRKFNEIVKPFNLKVKQVPGNILAGIFGFEEKGYFEAAEGTEEAPDISFE